MMMINETSDDESKRAKQHGSHHTHFSHMIWTAKLKQEQGTKARARSVWRSTFHWTPKSNLWPLLNLTEKRNHWP